MALKDDALPARSGLPARGSVRLIALRVLFSVLSSTPALVAAIGGMAGQAARRPYYTDIEGRLPLAQLIRLVKDLPPSLGPMVGLTVALTLLADQMLTGGALALLDPERPAGEPVKVVKTVFREGLTHLWAFLRAVALGAVFAAVGFVLIRIPFKRLDILGYHHAWTLRTQILVVPALAALVNASWLATVGAWVFWCRLITAADARTRVRRTGVLAFAVLRRRPLQTWGLFVAVTLASTLAPSAVLIAWRQAEPGSVGGALAWFLGWLCALSLQALAWLWLLRSGRRAYAGEAFSDLRAIPDDPYRVFARLARWWRARTASQAP